MRGEIARGAAWMVAFRLFDRSIGIVSTTLLARLLIPADFGLVAMAMSVIAFIELATSFSFEIALIQKADPQREHFDTAWTLNILLATGGGLVTAALAWPTAAMYGDPRLVEVMLCIAAAWMVSGCENTGVVNFRRRMDFSSEFRLMATKRVVTFVVTMAAAFVFRSYWALVVGMATGRLVGVLLSFLMEPFRPRLSLACARELLNFSGWILANNFAAVVLGKLPHFFVGRMFGAQSLGAYTVGSEIAQLAHTELVAPINRAMFPGYARLVSDIDNFRRVCTEATAAILLVVLPASFAVAVLASPIVRVLLGDQWHEAAPVIRVLAFAGAVTAVTSNNISAYLALGRPRLVTWIYVSRLVLFVVLALLFATNRGVSAIALCELAAALGSLLVSLPMLFRVVKVEARGYLASIWRPLLASVVASGGVHALLDLGVDARAFGLALLQLAIGLPVGLVLYVGTLALLWYLSGRPATVEVLIGQRLRDTIVAKIAPLFARRG